MPHARTHFPWLFLFSQTFPWPLLNSLTLPGFPAEWPRCNKQGLTGAFSFLRRLLIDVENVWHDQFDGVQVGPDDGPQSIDSGIAGSSNLDDLPRRVEQRLCSPTQEASNAGSHSSTGTTTTTTTTCCQIAQLHATSLTTLLPLSSLVRPLLLLIRQPRLKLVLQTCKEIHPSTEGKISQQCKILWATSLSDLT